MLDTFAGREVDDAESGDQVGPPHRDDTAWGRPEARARSEASEIIQAP
jgi:hypothetical protein